MASTARKPDSVWRRAMAFSARHHAGQFRKDGDTPYISHPARVALVVVALFRCYEPEVIAAALLHDVMEKAGVTYDEIESEFGARVAKMVSVLSKDLRLPGKRSEREYLQRLRVADWPTRLIKLADGYDNLCDAKTGEERKKRSKKAIAALALSTGSHPAMRLAREIVRSAVQAAQGRRKR